MYHGRQRVAVLFLLLWRACLPSDALASLEILTDSAIADTERRRTTFSISFTEPPDFFSVDEETHLPVHAFQYFYDAEPGGFEFAGEDVRIIRGAEIRFDRLIPIRESLNETGEEFPNAEGWGPTVGAVAFELIDETIAFTVPWDLLGEKDSSFTYVLHAYERGLLTSESTGGIMIPLPAAAWSAMVVLPVLLGGACARAVRRGSRP